MNKKNFSRFAFYLSIPILFTYCGGNADNLNVNDVAPDFTLSDINGNSYTLSEMKGKPVVIYFYPKASTAGCTKQACGIRDNRDKFENNNIEVIGISVDSKESIKAFIDDNNLNFPLLSDESKEVSKSYGVLNNLGLANRITFIIDREGKISRIMRDFDIDRHADDVFEYASRI